MPITSNCTRSLSTTSRTSNGSANSELYTSKDEQSSVLSSTNCTRSPPWMLIPTMLIVYVAFSDSDISSYVLPSDSSAVTVATSTLKSYSLYGSSSNL